MTAFTDTYVLLHQELGIQSEMPALLSKGQAQFEAEVANTSRLVTKVKTHDYWLKNNVYKSIILALKTLLSLLNAR